MFIKSFVDIFISSVYNSVLQDAAVSDEGQHVFSEIVFTSYDHSLVDKESINIKTKGIARLLMVRSFSFSFLFSFFFFFLKKKKNEIDKFIFVLHFQETLQDEKSRKEYEVKDKKKIYLKRIGINIVILVILALALWSVQAAVVKYSDDNNTLAR